MKNFKNYLTERRRDEIPPWLPPIGGYDYKPDFSGDRAPPGPQIDQPGGRGEVWEPKGPIGRPGGSVTEPGKINIPLRDVVKPNPITPMPGLEEVPAPSWWVGTAATWRSYLLWLARTAPQALAQLLAVIAPWFITQQAGGGSGHMYQDPQTGHWWIDTGEGWVEYGQDGKPIPLDTSPVKANEPISIE